MESLWQRYRDKGLHVVAISIDEGARSRIESYIKRLKLSFPVLLDPDGEVSARYQVSSLPENYLIDRNGQVIAHIVGSEDWASAEAFKLIDTLLSEK